MCPLLSFPSTPAGLADGLTREAAALRRSCGRRFAPTTWFPRSLHMRHLLCFASGDGWRDSAQIEPGTVANAYTGTRRPSRALGQPCVLQEIVHPLRRAL